MPLSKARNRERMGQFRLHKPNENREVQPKTIRIEGKDYIVPKIDADGNIIPE